jgi:hypothetical protein
MRASSKPDVKDFSSAFHILCRLRSYIVANGLDVGNREVTIQGEPWARQGRAPNKIPERVLVNDEEVTEDEIRNKIEALNLDDQYVFVEIYNLLPEQEGWLYDELNDDSKKPAGAVAHDLNQQKTPARRFVARLMKHSKIFSREEIETRRNNIGSKSRKLTTNGTLESAVRPFAKELAKFEKNDPVYADLIDFFRAFFEEFAQYHKAWQPGATSELRQKLRDESVALTNIIFFPLVRIAMRLWLESQADTSAHWSKADTWRTAIAKINGKVTAKDENGTEFKGLILDRNNPELKGRILVKSYDSGGNISWQLSSTRTTRESAYQYLCEKAGLPLPTPKKKAVTSA